MSLDKFVMRGFSNTLGSGEGKWVAPTQQYTGPVQRETLVAHQSGTSFVMGGGALKGRPTPTGDNERTYKEERYTFDRDAVRASGTLRAKRTTAGGAEERLSLIEAANTKRGNQVVMGIVLYGIFLVLGIALLMIYFGDGSDDGSYASSAGFSREVQPMWERTR